jgi:hypothetical protein
MGLDRNGLKFLLFAKSTGVNFEKTGSLGRQGIHTSDREYRIICQSTTQSLPEQKPTYFEPILSQLGANSIDVFDYSNYEGATITADFNQPLSESLHRQYSCFIEAG